MHDTTRRCFIGPIPEGWLKSHRKSWYKQSLNLSNYSSRQATFSASPSISQQRRISGLDGPSTSAALAHSFPQPDDVNSEEEDQQEGTTTDAHGSDTSDGQTEPLRAQASPSNPKKPSPKPLPQFKKRMVSTPSDQATDTRTFVTAPTKPRKSRQQAPGSLQPSRSPPASFVTAVESSGGSTARLPVSARKDETGNTKIPSNKQRPSHQDGSSSTASLLQNSEAPAIDSPTQESQPKSNPVPATSSGTEDTSPEVLMPQNESGTGPQISKAPTQGLIRFNVPEQTHTELDAKIKLKQADRRRLWRHRHGQRHPGEIVKAEKMLVKMDSTMQELDADFDENDSQKIETRAIEKWREYVVVCRESTDEGADYSLQLYKTRVIPSVEQTKVAKRSAHEIPLNRKSTKINLYSSLDKTLVIWVPWKQGRAIYILRPRSGASSVEWYTFLRGVLGRKRPPVLQVNVPDLSVSLQLDDPFGHLESSEDALEASKGDRAALDRAMEAERAIAGDIIARCMKMLEKDPEWSNILDKWLRDEKMGLAWKRYDRLEWIHGANEQKMYGTMAMQKSHELELRPKQHYPTSTKSSEKGTPEILEEPAPVEGFLIRLTSQKGRSRRLGKMFFKRLYFTTHNQYLCYCRPAKAIPPPSPKMSHNASTLIPSISEIVEKTPLIYSITPYPLEDGEIAWLKHGNNTTKQKHDGEAYKEAERSINSLLNAEGYINLSHVVRVRNAVRGSVAADANTDRGDDVSFHQEVSDTRRDDGKIDSFDDDRTFEMQMENGLIIRLQAYNEDTKNEWMIRLEKLVSYWKARLIGDMDQFKSIRRANLKSLDIDEEAESYLGQYGRKWEVTRSVASPQLFNMCSISCCRTITMSGFLYHKPRRHTTFIRCGVILCHGQMLIFHGTLRERSGKEMPHIQHERSNVIDLKDCYIYSGLVTEGDLLYQNQTFDSNHPGHHALPRIYRNDGWTSTDEDTMTCFVIWQARRRSFFKAREDQGEGKTRQRLRYVSQLGVPGRSIVFKTRSRAERDHWVLSVGMEIDRLQQGEEIRVVPQK